MRLKNSLLASPAGIPMKSGLWIFTLVTFCSMMLGSSQTLSTTSSEYLLLTVSARNFLNLALRDRVLLVPSRMAMLPPRSSRKCTRSFMARSAISSRWAWCSGLPPSKNSEFSGMPFWAVYSRR